jgi:hypothetical protein
MIKSRVVAISLVDGLALFSDSTSTYKVEDLDIPELADLLPHAESLQLHWLLEDVAVNEIDWNIDAFPGWDRNHEAASVSFFAADRTDVGPVLAAITNVTAAVQYMKHFRLLLRWRLHTGVSSAKSGKLSAILYVTLKGQ